MVISSLDNKKVKIINSLKIAKKRKEFGLFLVEGMHLVMEAYKSGYLKEIYLLENETLDFDCDLEITYLTYEVMQKLTTLKTPSSVIGVCKTLDNKKIIGKKILLLDNIQDPGNLGTIIRSACAFSTDTIVLSENSVDLYNEKVIRSTQGMIFKVNILVDNLIKVIDYLEDNDYEILGTDVKNGVNVKNIHPTKFALIMGNEGKGVSEEIKSRCHKNLYIKMNHECESLNVGVATSILLYELGEENE